MNPSSNSKFHVRAFEARTLVWWRSRKDKIDMDPPYQRRGRLWSQTDKAFLIDSILNGFDLPKIYMADFTWGESRLNKKRLPYAIIDGKQRFEAIFDFFEGRVTLNEDFLFREDQSLRLGGLGYRDLQKNHPSIAEAFDNFNLHVMAVYAVEEALINELFVRLNRSKPLTGAEIRNAMGGPVPEILREIASHGFFKESVRFTVTRGQDLNAAAKLLLFEYYGAPRETKKVTLDAFVENAKHMNRDARARLELAARHVVDTLRDMENIFLPRDYLLASAGIVPVYYWLSRDLDDYEQSNFREFLVRFENERRANRELARDRPTSGSVDSQLVEFDNYNRSTNDQISHEKRYAILNSRFRDFLKSKKAR